MKMFYSPKVNSFYPEEFKSEYVKSKSWPDDLVEVSDADFLTFGVNTPPNGKERGYVDNTLFWKDIEVDAEFLKLFERSWRDSELKRADVELYKVQDSDPKAKGSVGDWRAYRKALRSWPEHPQFPSKELRPVAPDV